MTIISEDGEVVVSVGGAMIMHSLYSTAKVRIRMSGLKVGAALDFLRTGECKKEKIRKALCQMEVIKVALSEINPEDAIYDCNDLKKEASWKGNISSSVVSCADLFTTDEGQILIDELINLLAYAEKNNLSVILP